MHARNVIAAVSVPLATVPKSLDNANVNLNLLAYHAKGKLLQQLNFEILNSKSNKLRGNIFNFNQMCRWIYWLAELYTMYMRQNWK